MNLTFKQIWTTIKTVWQSRPFALILPIIALVVYWWTHGHSWTAASFPTMGEWVAGTTLLFTKFGKVMEVFVGPPAPETLPPPVTTPILAKAAQRITGANPTIGDGPKIVGLILLIGLGFMVSACSFFQKHVDVITTDISSCVGSNESQDKKDLMSAAGQFLKKVLTCDVVDGGFSPANLVADLPVCALEALPGIEASLGPDGKAFVTCALNKIESDPNALAVIKTRARLARKSINFHPGAQ